MNVILWKIKSLHWKNVLPCKNMHHSYFIPSGVKNKFRRNYTFNCWKLHYFVCQIHTILPHTALYIQLAIIYFKQIYTATNFKLYRSGYDWHSNTPILYPVSQIKTDLEKKPSYLFDQSVHFLTSWIPQSGISIQFQFQFKVLFYQLRITHCYWLYDRRTEREFNNIVTTHTIISIHN
jgi:hypothetical protein